MPHFGGKFGLFQKKPFSHHHPWGVFGKFLGWSGGRYIFGGFMVNFGVFGFFLWCISGFL